MPDRATAESWLGKRVDDAAGAEIGTCTSVYADDATQVMEWLSTTLPDGRDVLVPLVDAHEVDGRVRVTVTRDRVLSAPTSGTGGHISEPQEMALYEHYGIAYSTSRSSTVLPVGAAPAGADTDAAPAGTPATSRATPGPQDGPDAQDAEDAGTGSGPGEWVPVDALPSDPDARSRVGGPAVAAASAGVAAAGAVVVLARRRRGARRRTRGRDLAAALNGRDFAAAARRGAGSAGGSLVRGSLTTTAAGVMAAQQAAGPARRVGGTVRRVAVTYAPAARARPDVVALVLAGATVAVLARRARRPKPAAAAPVEAVQRTSRRRRSARPDGESVHVVDVRALPTALPTAVPTAVPTASPTPTTQSGSD